MRLTTNFDVWPPEATVFPVTVLDLRVIDDPHPFHLAERDAIARNWQSEVAANPALFDGRMLLQRAVHIADGAICGEAHVVPFSAFLWWRKHRRIESALHLFALPIILSSDGAVIAVRMAPHTANPGKVYCAAGSLDLSDIVEGRCDIDGNMAREVAEETGLDLAEALPDAGYHAAHHGGSITIVRCYRFAQTAEALLARIDRHIETEADASEIDLALAIQTCDPDLHAYPPFMPTILRWIFQPHR